ncbi:hypothetical protein AVEN_172185-1, partial [Araneus ventricosus]
MRTSAGLSYSRIEITKDSRTKCLGSVHESRDEVLASHCNPPRAVYSYQHGPFVTYLHRFGLCLRDRCVCVDNGDPDHYATVFLMTKSFHLMKTSAENLWTWCENIAQNKRSLARLVASTPLSNSVLSFILQILVNSSSVDRCLRSAEALVAAFYAPQGIWKFEEDLNWQPIPVHYLPAEKDKYLSFASFCPRSVTDSKRLYNSRQVQEVFQKHK